MLHAVLDWRTTRDENSDWPGKILPSKASINQKDFSYDKEVSYNKVHSLFKKKKGERYRGKYGMLENDPISWTVVEQVLAKYWLSKYTLVDE